MVITDANITSSTWDSIRTKLVALAPAVINNATTTTTVASIKAVYNDEASSRPIIVINPIIMSEDSWKFQSNEGKKMLNVIIDCYYNQTYGVDQLYDTVRAGIVLDDIAGIGLVGISTDYSFDPVGAQKNFRKTLTAVYERE